MQTFEDLRDSLSASIEEELEADPIIKYYSVNDIGELEKKTKIEFKEIQILQYIKYYYKENIAKCNFYGLIPPEGSELPEIPAYLHIEVSNALTSAVYEGPGNSDFMSPLKISISVNAINPRGYRQIIIDTYKRFLRLFLLLGKLQECGYIIV
jgi:hypothetical protein